MNKNIELMDTREKLIYLRRALKTTQRALAGDTLTKEFISMVEGGKRNMSREVAITVMKNALNLANEKGIDLGLDEEYLTRSKEDDLCEICDKLDNTMENMDNFNKIIEYAEENNYPWAKIMATKKIGNALFVNKQISKAYEKYISCINMIDKLRSNRYKENIYICLGSISVQMLQYEEALIYYEEALNYCYINNTLNMKNNIIYNTALTYYYLNDFHRSLKEIYKFKKEESKERLIVKIEALKGLNYMKIKSLEEALNIYNKLLKSYDIEGWLKVAIYNNMALCYMYKGDYKNSNGYYDLAITLGKSMKMVIYKVVLDQGHMNRVFGKYEEAKSILLEGMNLSKNIEDYEYKLRYLEELYLVEESQNNTKNMKEKILEILTVSKQLNLQNNMVWARKKLIDIAIKENDLSILKEA